MLLHGILKLIDESLAERVSFLWPIHIEHHYTVVNLINFEMSLFSICLGIEETCWE